MASSPSPGESDSVYTDSEGSNSSSASESTQREVEVEEEVPLHPTSDSPQKPQRTLKPYTHSTSNVYAASSSFLTIAGRPVSPTHSKPAAADEILCYNQKSKIPPTVDQIMRNKEVTDHLPDSDLLKAVHAYASEFYTAKGWDGIAGRSMDESALIAIGVLLEEWCKEMIGENGDMVFVEKEGG
ncbi:hypothetical protein ABW20_dc0102047 [Dactylellina cionopaga]|nr:hypothetical protein ABW20_dc0102047 [Dactylellina cionopaga]